jgi:hypothetical protein
MDAMMWIILIAALILAARSAASFEVTSRRNQFSQPSESSLVRRDVSSEAEQKAQPASVNTPAPGEVALISAALPCCQTGQGHV